MAIVAKKPRVCATKTFKKDSLSADSSRDSVFTVHRNEAARLDEVAQAGGLLKLAEKMRDCSPILEFNKLADIATGEIKYKLKRAFFCHKRFCPVCVWRKSLMWKAKFLNMIPKLIEDNKNHRFLLLTLTVPNCDISDLRETLIAMNSAWKRLIQRKEFRIIRGFIRATEVTQSSSQAGNAHPHFHVLILVPPSYFSIHYITQAKWLELWRSCMRDNSITQVDIRRVKDNSDAAAEVLKYATKAGDLIGKGANHQQSVNWFVEYTKQVFKMRFIATGGLLLDVLKDEDIEKDLVNIEEDKEKENGLEVGQVKYRYVRKDYDYFKFK